MAEEQPQSNADTVSVFNSSNHDAEQEALEIRSLLEANGIESVVVGPTVIPSLEFQVQVTRDNMEQARRIIDEAREAGPAAADEAEAASENPVSEDPV